MINANPERQNRIRDQQYLSRECIAMNAKRSVSGLLILFGLFSVISLQAAENEQESVQVIAVDTAMDFVAQHDNAVIMDVRMPVEYDMSHITGALNIDVRDDSFEQMASALDRDKTYIVHCTANPADGRSSRALDTLRNLGFKNLYSLEGGYVAWKEAELPLTERSN